MKLQWNKWCATGEKTGKKTETENGGAEKQKLRTQH